MDHLPPLPRLPDVDALALGASSGGVQALLAVLGALPAGLGCVVLVVLHRPPRPLNDRSLAALFARVCRLPVSDAMDRQPLRPGQVLLAPADHHLLVDPGPVASLSLDEPVLWSRPALDPLFESAAWVFGPRLLACVFSGASADGAAGTAAVRRHGGQVWVQRPDDAAAAVMPRAALQRAGADRQFRLSELCDVLRQAGPRSTT